jgi:hypothetical protein
VIPVAKFLINPDYPEDNSSTSLEQMTEVSKNDLALALLTRPLPASVRPASLPDASMDVLALKAVTAAGYGTTKKTSKGMSGGGHLRFTSFPGKHLRMKNGMIVATDGSTGICEGDSGGPLFAGSGRSAQNVVVGVSDFTLPVPNSLLKRLRYQWTAVYNDDFMSYAKAHPNDELCLGHNGFVDVGSHRDWILQAAGEVGVFLPAPSGQ